MAKMTILPTRAGIMYECYNCRTVLGPDVADKHECWCEFCHKNPVDRGCAGLCWECYDSERKHIESITPAHECEVDDCDGTCNLVEPD